MNLVVRDMVLNNLIGKLYMTPSAAFPFTTEKMVCGVVMQHGMDIIIQLHWLRVYSYSKGHTLGLWADRA